MSTLTLDQATAFAVAAGFHDVALETILAIAQAESGLVTDARNVNTDSYVWPDGHTGPSTDRGIIQINNWWWPRFTDAMCDDPAQAFAAGWTITQQGTKFTDWSTYNSGAYLKYMTSVLPAGIPRNPAPLSQLHEPTKDGFPDENTSENCGEAAAAWVVRDIGSEGDCDGDEIHDEVIGQGVIGGSDLLAGSSINPKYAAALSKRGVTLAPYFAPQAQLIAKAHAVLNLPAGDALANFGGGSQYLNQFSDPVHFGGFGHICVLAHNVAGGIELMDPWVGNWRTYTDAQLAQMIVWGYIVVATPMATGGTTSMAGVPAGWTDDGKALHNPVNSNVIGGGFYGVVKSMAWDPSDVPLSNEYSVDQVELANTSFGPGVVQYTRLHQLSWVSGNGPAGVGQPWVTWVGSEAHFMRGALAQAQTQLSAAADATAQLHAQLTSSQTAAATLTSQLAQASAANATLQSQINALMNAPAPVALPAPEADAMIKLTALLDSLGIAHK